MLRRITCVSCPTGCTLEVTEKNGKVLSVRGNTCKRGLSYAKAEVEDPKRMLTTTVRVKNGAHAMLPVRTSRPIPKALIIPCMRELKRITAAAPVRQGDVLLRDVLHTGVDIVATRPVARASREATQ